MQKILSSTTAATGRQLKQSVNVFHNLILYLRLPKTVLSDQQKKNQDFFLQFAKKKFSFENTFIIETIDPIDGSALVISSQQKEVLWILDLISKEQSDGFQTLFTSVNIITPIFIKIIVSKLAKLPKCFLQYFFKINVFFLFFIIL